MIIQESDRRGVYRKMQGAVPKPILKNRVEILTPVTASIQPLPKKLLDRVRDAIRVKHYSYQTEKTYSPFVAYPVQP
jgi:hypothetical protein